MNFALKTEQEEGEEGGGQKRKKGRERVNAL